MLQKYDLKDFPNIDSLHDCETSSIELLNNKLIFYFEKDGLDILLPNGEQMYPYKKLKATYVLSNDFCDEEYIPAVRYINQRKVLRKNAVQFWTLKKLIDFLQENKNNLRFYSQYFNNRKYIINAELIEKNIYKMGVEFNIEIFINEIIYEWIE